mmetsp:Transcript_16859/g.35627  ORF Transcript_16859/g.35627 Transcript_16859/m.35627 type:complete len:82 (-) Transcript_16859:36-281(-)
MFGLGLIHQKHDNNIPVRPKMSRGIDGAIGGVENCPYDHSRTEEQIQHRDDRQTINPKGRTMLHVRKRGFTLSGFLAGEFS